MASLILKIRTFVGLIQNTSTWPTYYLDYLRSSHKDWIFKHKNLSIKVRANSVDKWIAAEEFALDVYRIRKLDPAAFDQIFDIGAQIGTFCIHAAYIFPAATVISLEPDFKNFGLLTENIALNNLTNRITAINAAVSDNDGDSLNLYHGADSAARSSYVQSEKFVTVKNFNFKKLKDMIKGRAFLKLDIEGGEISLFTSKYLELLKAFSYMVVEYHHFLPTHQKEPFEKFLVDNGFNFERDDLIYFIKPNL